MVNIECIYVKQQSRKKREDSLETRAEQAALRAYVENQAMLEPIPLYRASKYKQTQKLGFQFPFIELSLYLPMQLISGFFSSFLCQDTIHARIKLCKKRLQLVEEAN